MEERLHRGVAANGGVFACTCHFYYSEPCDELLEDTPPAEVEFGSQFAYYLRLLHFRHADGTVGQSLFGESVLVDEVHSIDGVYQVLYNDDGVLWEKLQ